MSNNKNAPPPASSTTKSTVVVDNDSQSVSRDNRGGEHRLRAENLPFDIDVWYPCLQQYTFPSIFLPLTRRDAEAIVNHYDYVYRRQQHSNANITNTYAQLLDLEMRIDRGLEELNKKQMMPTITTNNKGAFLRLCGRSPKDGEPTDPNLRTRIWESYSQNVQDLLRHEHSDDDNDDDIVGNARVAAIAHTPSCLRVYSGQQAMSILLTSERVFSDMLDWLEYGEPEQIVLRQFCDKFDLSTEFRCYIDASPPGILVAISQYDTYAKHKFLQDGTIRAQIVRAIVREWYKVRNCIETIDGSYCVDFGVDLQANRAYLIELSPFRSCTGPALFAWKIEPNPPVYYDKKKNDNDNDVTDRNTGPKLLVPDRPDVHDDRIVSLLEDNDVDDDDAAGGECRLPSSSSWIADDAVFRVRSEVIPRIGDLVEMNWDYRWSPDRVDIPQPYRDIYTAAEAATPPLANNMSISKHNNGPTNTSTWKSAIRTWLYAPFADQAQQQQQQQQQPPLQEQISYTLFVYGTLKRDCHWHSKYMTGGQFLGTATTSQPQSLVIGECGVPYLIQTTTTTTSSPSATLLSNENDDPQAKPVRGELWRISNDMLRGIDDYEGIQKGHYTRQEIDVDVDCHGDGGSDDNGGSSSTLRIVRAHCYFYAIKPGASGVDMSLLHAERISEYPAKEQKKRYKPIHHIQVKQLQYLGEEATT